MFVAMIRNTETKTVEQVHLPVAIDEQEATSMANRIADQRHANTGIFHRVQDIIEVVD